MPLVSVENFDADVQLGLWRMDETDFSSDSPVIRLSGLLSSHAQAAKGAWR